MHDTLVRFRVNQSLLAKVNAMADDHVMTLSEFLRDCLRRRVREGARPGRRETARSRDYRRSGLSQ